MEAERWLCEFLYIDDDDDNLCIAIYITQLDNSDMSEGGAHAREDNDLLLSGQPTFTC